MFKNELKEKDIEKYLRDEIKKLGGIAYKFVSPGNAGVPDRLVLLPGRWSFFVELKAPGKKTRAIQDSQIRKIRDLGFGVMIIDSKQQIDGLVREARKRLERTK
ncbi:VRR-NUC domain-containing protein [Sebaldella sp. S0638]|uniref:VRR-NUC domain-containing protein n=1 Tax=Sebaldella sp. S0638 TaxID=2957809 RepID=UPI00209E7CAD|nr:VRR-NUC domain-containing protein [Sebaldella sp. S0638]MCP1225695.1 VRR-NUC domain-containing protein [Sebaldella sp. S0638]